MGKNLLTAALVALAAAGVAGAGMQAEPLLVVAQRVDVKWSPTGRLLGWLGSGARVERVSGRDEWSRVKLGGWMPATSLGSPESGPSGATLMTILPFEEPLREEAEGAIVGGLRRGTQVTVPRRAGAWAQVEMVGWLPDAATAPEPGTGAPARAAAAPTSGPAPSAGGVALLSRAVEVKEAPGGRNLAALAQGTVVTAIETRGGWTRIALQGWVPSSAVRATAVDEVRPEVVAAADPDAFVGRRTTWTVEHVSVQRADRLRRDFRDGELFVLARSPGAGGAVYVYLAVPAALEPSFRDLAPFATLRVVGTIRTGRSALTGNPILDVTEVLP